MVIFDAGLGETSAAWDAVIPKVSAPAILCTYDRAGLGQSDPRPEPHGATSAVNDLHALLAQAHLAAPYILVGASFGGLDAQLFARRYPHETAGVVLVDSLQASWDRRLAPLLTPAQIADRLAIPTGEDMTNEDIRSSEDAVPLAPAFPTVPLVVLRHGLPFGGGPGWPTEQVEALWMSLQQDLASLSSQSVLLTAAASGHAINLDQPDLVAAAVDSVVDPGLWPPSASQPPEFGLGAPDVAPGRIPGTLVFGTDAGLQEAAGDGAHARVIVPAQGMLLGDPSVDSDGTHLAYTVSPVPVTSSGPQPTVASQVWVLDIATGKRVRLADDGEMPAISPNGRFIAYAAQGRTILVQSDGHGQRDLGAGGCATWSPDSTRIAVCTAAGAIEFINVSDGQRMTIPTGPGSNEPTAWSPDGSALAFASDRDGNAEVYVVDTDGSNERRLTTAPGDQAAYAWTAGGLLVTSSTPGAIVSDWFLVDPVTGKASIIRWLRGIPDPIGYVP